MNQFMDESYFEEKKSLALEGIKRAIDEAYKASALISAMRYTMPNMVNPAQIHELLTGIELAARKSGNDLAKGLWAASKSPLEFNDWLHKSGHAELL